MLRTLGIVTIALLICVSAALVQAQESADPYADVPKSRLADGGFLLGNTEAEARLIEFSDFLCTSCQNYEPIIRRFIHDYVLNGRAQFEYRSFAVVDPVLSGRSASLVECADALAPGQFWRARDLMFELASTRGFTDADCRGLCRQFGPRSGCALRLRGQRRSTCD